jgi:hypothetical protein
MVDTTSPTRVEVVCPICREFVMTYTQKDDTANGMVDWYRRWPKGTENPKSDARSQFLGEYLTDGILPDRFQNKKRGSPKDANGDPDFRFYAKGRNGEKWLRR